jgi:hypothetical protein
MWRRRATQSEDYKNQRFAIMKNKAVKIGIVASVLPHLFCCVLPIILAIVGLFAPEVAHSSFIPEWLEPWLFVFSALMLGLSWILVLPDCPCSECEDEKNHKTFRQARDIVPVFYFICIFWVFKCIFIILTVEFSGGFLYNVDR